MSERSKGCGLSVICDDLRGEVLSADGTCPFIFADNWSFASQTIAGCKLAYQSLGSLCNAFKLQVSPAKTWVWATAPEFRKRLQHVSCDGVRVPLMWRAKDLGVDVNYTLRRQKTVWRSRFHKMKTSMTKVRVSKLPARFKQRLALGGCSSASTFGQSWVQVSKSDFKSWRAAAAKVLGFNGPGENSKIAFSLSGDDCDPQLLDLLQRCCYWRRFLWKFPALKAKFLCVLNSGGLPHRPAGSLATSASLLGWIPNGSNFMHRWFGPLDWLRCSVKFLRFALCQTWRRAACVCVCVCVCVCAELSAPRPTFKERGSCCPSCALMTDELGIIPESSAKGSSSKSVCLAHTTILTPLTCTAPQHLHTSHHLRPSHTLRRSICARRTTCAAHTHYAAAFARIAPRTLHTPLHLHRSRTPRRSICARRLRVAFYFLFFKSRGRVIGNRRSAPSAGFVRVASLPLWRRANF